MRNNQALALLLTILSALGVAFSLTYCFPETCSAQSAPIDKSAPVNSPGINAPQKPVCETLPLDSTTKGAVPCPSGMTCVVGASSGSTPNYVTICDALLPTPTGGAGCMPLADAATGGSKAGSGAATTSSGNCDCPNIVGVTCLCSGNSESPKAPPAVVCIDTPTPTPAPGTPTTHPSNAPSTPGAATPTKPASNPSETPNPNPSATQGPLTSPSPGSQPPSKTGTPNPQTTTTTNPPTSPTQAAGSTPPPANTSSIPPVKPTSTTAPQSPGKPKTPPPSTTPQSPGSTPTATPTPLTAGTTPQPPQPSQSPSTATPVPQSTQGPGTPNPTATPVVNTSPSAGATPNTSGPAKKVVIKIEAEGRTRKEFDRSATGAWSKKWSDQSEKIEGFFEKSFSSDDISMGAVKWWGENIDPSHPIYWRGGCWPKELGGIDSTIYFRCGYGAWNLGQFPIVCSSNGTLQGYCINLWGGNKNYKSTQECRIEWTDDPRKWHCPTPTPVTPTPTSPPTCPLIVENSCSGGGSTCPGGCKDVGDGEVVTVGVSIGISPELQKLYDVLRGDKSFSDASFEADIGLIPNARISRIREIIFSGQRDRRYFRSVQVGNNVTLLFERIRGEGGWYTWVPIQWAGSDWRTDLSLDQKNEELIGMLMNETFVNSIQTVLTTQEVLANLFPGVYGVNQIISGDQKILGVVSVAADLGSFGIGKGVTFLGRGVLSSNTCRAIVVTGAAVRVTNAAQNPSLLTGIDAALAIVEGSLVGTHFVQIFIRDGKGFVKASSSAAGAKSIAKVLGRSVDDIAEGGSGIPCDQLAQLGIKPIAPSWKTFAGDFLDYVKEWTDSFEVSISAKYNGEEIGKFTGNTIYPEAKRVNLGTVKVFGDENTCRHGLNGTQLYRSLFSNRIFKENPGAWKIGTYFGEDNKKAYQCAFDAAIAAGKSGEEAAIVGTKATRWYKIMVERLGAEITQYPVGRETLAVESVLNMPLKK